MSVPVAADDPKSYIQLKRKHQNDPQYQPIGVSAAEDKQQGTSLLDPSQASAMGEFEPSGAGAMASPPKKRLFVTVDAGGNQVQVEVPEGVNPDENNSYMANGEDINLDLSSYSYSVVVDGIVEGIDNLNNCQYNEDEAKMIKQQQQGDMDSDSDGQEDHENKEYILAEPSDGDPLFKSHYRMSRLVASVSSKLFSV